jgi:hypothetical protein
VQLRTATSKAIAGFAAPAAAGEAADFLGEREFSLACRLIGEYAGIKLSPHKRNMVYNRLVRRLRARGIDAPLVILSAVQSDSIVARALEAGANDFLLKHLTYGERLEGEVERFLGR